VIKQIENMSENNKKQVFGREFWEMGRVVILIKLLLLDYCVFERKMGVKSAPKSAENVQKRALFTRNWCKSALFEQVLEQGTGVRG